MTGWTTKLYSTAWIWTCSFLITEKGNLRSTKNDFITVSSKGSETQRPRTRRALDVKQRPTALGLARATVLLFLQRWACGVTLSSLDTDGHKLPCGDGIWHGHTGAVVRDAADSAG